MTVAPARRSANHWPGLDVVPTGLRTAVSARVARRLFSAATNRLAVTVELAATPTRPATTLGRGGPVMSVHRPDDFFARLARHALIGFGESYLAREWDAEDLGEFLTVLAAEVQHLVPEPLQRARKLVVARPPSADKSSVTNSRDNIAHHYDLSNDLFELFLDPTLSYSSALFNTAELALRPTQDQLESAQVRKIERLLDQAGVGEGTRLLEIGSGWGELAIRAARRGAQVTTITLSTEQQTLARQRVSAADAAEPARAPGTPGLADRVSVELCDYRNVEGTFDAVVSVEMIEAVGWQYWQTYFEMIDRVLAPRGKAAIQAITMPHDRMLATRNTYTWINKYIFPGGFLPSVQAIDEITQEFTSLRISDNLSMGASYAETLRLWDERFLAASEQVLALGFDETFLRMWHFYLDYSRAGFASGYLDVNQLTFQRYQTAAEGIR